MLGERRVAGTTRESWALALHGRSAVRLRTPAASAVLQEEASGDRSCLTRALGTETSSRAACHGPGDCTAREALAGTDKAVLPPPLTRPSRPRAELGPPGPLRTVGQGVLVLPAGRGVREGQVTTVCCFRSSSFASGSFLAVTLLSLYHYESSGLGTKL